MKRIFLLVLSLVFLLGACGQKSPTWQEQYDLGIRYLSEGNYEEAIIAFTAAIEIDPKQAPAFVGRGDAYVGSGEAEEILVAAFADYEKAIELDGTLTEAYLGLADLYVRQGKYERALEILQKGLELTGNNSDISDRLIELEAETAEPAIKYNTYGAIEFTQREDYRDAKSLTDEELPMIRTAMALTESEDIEGLYQLARQYEGATKDILTILDGYKVWFYMEGSVKVEVQMRPENGDGYCATASVGPGERQSIWGTCECTGWQWNGTMTEKSVAGDYRFSETGPVENSLKNGVFESKDGFGNAWKSVFQDGVRVEFIGETEEPDGSLWSVHHKYNESTALEYLYW